MLAANPPVPQRGPDLSDEDFDQHLWDWCDDLNYEDPHIYISLLPAVGPDEQKKGFQVDIYPNTPGSHLDNDEEEGGKAVFIGSAVWGRDEDPATTYGDIVVDCFLSGPWIDYLNTVAERAWAIIQARPPTSDGEGR